MIALVIVALLGVFLLYLLWPSNRVDGFSVFFALCALLGVAWAVLVVWLVVQAGLWLSRN